MIFTQIPDDLSPIGLPLIYGFSGGEGQLPFEIQICEAATNKPIAVKRLTDKSSSQIDISPILRRMILFSPQAGESNIIDAEQRMVAIKVMAAETTSPIRRFTACSARPSSPSLISTMPMHRIISIGEQDELTLCAAGQLSVCVETSSEDRTEAKYYEHFQTGEYIALFRLDTSEMAANTERITIKTECNGELFCRVEYAVVPHQSKSVRLVWRSSEGSIEHHTFPVVKSEAKQITRKKILGAAGYADTSIETELTRTLLSAYQRTATVEALAEIASSSQVWELFDKKYTLIDIPLQDSVLKRNGGLRYIEVITRSKLKKRLL